MEMEEFYDDNNQGNLRRYRYMNKIKNRLGCGNVIYSWMLKLMVI